LYGIFISLIITLFSWFLGADEVYKSSWFAFESLRFIWDKNKPRPTLSTVKLLVYQNTIMLLN